MDINSMTYNKLYDLNKKKYLELREFLIEEKCSLTDKTNKILKTQIGGDCSGPSSSGADGSDVNGSCGGKSYE
jgi:hypothetical protein